VTVSVQQAQVPDFTINTSSAIIPEGSAATITGVLHQPGTATPEPSTSVSLWSHAAGHGRFRKIAETITASDGSYSFAPQPTVNTVYQVRTTFAPPRHTAALFQGVRDVIALQAAPLSTTVGGRVQFTGSVTPDKAHHLVYLQRLGSDGHWHAVDVRRVNAGSTFRFAWVFGKSGTHVFRARVFSDSRNVGAASQTVTITVSGVAPVLTLPPAS
jgi:hypothetical protein